MKWTQNSDQQTNKVDSNISSSVGLGSKNMHFTSLIIHGQLFPLVTLVWVQIDGDSSQQKKIKERTGKIKRKG
jgi:hypothetical protein